MKQYIVIEIYENCPIGLSTFETKEEGLKYLQQLVKENDIRDFEPNETSFDIGDYSAWLERLPE